MTDKAEKKAAPKKAAAKKKANTTPEVKVDETQTHQDIPFTPTEEIPHEETGLVVLTAEQQADKEVARFGDPLAWIAQKKSEYSGLKIAGIDDKEGYKKVKEGWQEMRNRRLGVASKHKEIKGDYLIITRRVDSAKNTLTELIEEVEDPLKAELDRIDALKQEEKDRKEREEQERIQNRVTSLIAAGMNFDGKFYSIGEAISMDVVTLKDMEDDRFNELVESVSAKKKEIDDAEAKRLQDEEDERKRVADQKEENERQADELKKQQEDLKSEKRDARLEILTAIGYIQSEINGDYIFTAGKFQHRFAKKDLADLTSEEWKIMQGEAKVKSDIIKKSDTDDQEQAKKDKEAQDKADQDKKDLDARVTLRTQQLKDRFEVDMHDSKFKRLSVYETVKCLAVEPEFVRNATPEEWEVKVADLKTEFEEVVALEKAELKKIQEEDELARKAALSDAQAVNEWSLTLAACMAAMPKLKDRDLATALKVFDDNVARELEVLLGIVEVVEKA